MAAVKDPSPLNWQVPIVDNKGLPTPEFMRAWQAMRRVLAASPATGTAGEDGLNGFGMDGADGEDGLPGIPGSPGSAGITGAAGPAGPPGVDGADGDESAGLLGIPAAPTMATAAAVLTASALTQGDDGVRGIKTLANVAAGQVLASGTPPAWTTSPALTAITLGGGSSLGQYVQGTWTPMDGSGASLSITVNNAEYTQIGRYVFFELNVTYPVTADGSDALLTLPVLPRSQIYLALFQMSGGSTIEQALIDGAFPGVKIDNPTTGTYLTNVQLSNKTFFISGSYNS